MADPFDILIIGGGIVGLSTAWHLSQRFPRLRLTVLEKESTVAAHQSGHNSGVIHSGIYYKPGSLKASMCVEGAAAMVCFCEAHNIPHEMCGKVIVATENDELPRLEELFSRGNANRVPGVRKISPAELREIEPNCSGVAALHVASTGITDYRQVCAKLKELIESNGGQVRLATRVIGMQKIATGFVVKTTTGEIFSRHVINCAGLYSDVISRMAGDVPEVRIMPFRGEYYDLIRERQTLIRSLIYPVPDPRFPFLGVHFTRRISGTVDAGPNAVLALKREGYGKTDFSIGDTLDAMCFSGLWRMAGRYWRNGVGELYRSMNKGAFVRALQRLVPDVTSSDLVPGGAGVRAQALRPDGTLVDDFQFSASSNLLNVFNVPSPAATASLPIGRTIAEMAARTFNIEVR